MGASSDKVPPITSALDPDLSAVRRFIEDMIARGAIVALVAAILALKEHVAPPTINLDDLDDDAPIDVATEPRPLSKRGSEPMAVLNNAFGFGGHNVSLVFTAA